METILDDIRKEIADRQAEKFQTLCVTQRLEEEIECLRNALCDQRRCEEEKRKTLEEAKCMMNHLKNEKGQLEQCLQSKECEISAMQNPRIIMDKLNACVCSLVKDIECKKKQNSCLQEQILQLEICGKKKDCFVFCVERRQNKMEYSICELKQKKKYSQDENLRLRNELQECKCCFKKKKKEHDRMSEQLKEQKIEKMCCQLDEIQSCLAKKNHALQSKQICNIKLSEQLGCSQVESTKLCTESQYLRAEQSELRKKLNCARKHLKTCQCEYERVACECDRIKKTLGEFKEQLVKDGKSSSIPVQ